LCGTAATRQLRKKTFEMETQSPVEIFGQTYCVIDQQNLFVSAVLEDELLLLDAPEGTLARIQSVCARFNGFCPEPKRLFTSYSGGEQAILCCVLLMLLVPDGTPVLLVHVPATLSKGNRTLLRQVFAEFLPASPLHILGPGGPHA
jgi:hypothetical protein